LSAEGLPMGVDPVPTGQGRKADAREEVQWVNNAKPTTRHVCRRFCRRAGRSVRKTLRCNNRREGGPMGDGGYFAGPDCSPNCVCG
jgi:hypothetical protein